MPDEPHETRNAMVGVLVTPSTKKELKRLAKEKEKRSLSDFSGLLILKGLELYYKDGDLTTPRNLPFMKGSKK